LCRGIRNLHPSFNSIPNCDTNCTNSVPKRPNHVKKESHTRKSNHPIHREDFLLIVSMALDHSSHRTLDHWNISLYDSSTSPYNFQPFGADKYFRRIPTKNHKMVLVTEACLYIHANHSIIDIHRAMHDEYH
jgi:hypothetical protein